MRKFRYKEEDEERKGKTDTLDECPMAYKGMDDIINNIEETVEIDRIIKPIYNFKASGD